MTTSVTHFKRYVKINSIIKRVCIFLFLLNLSIFGFSFYHSILLNPNSDLTDTNAICFAVTLVLSILLPFLPLINKDFLLNTYKNGSIVLSENLCDDFSTVVNDRLPDNKAALFIDSMDLKTSFNRTFDDNNMYEDAMTILVGKVNQLYLINSTLNNKTFTIGCLINNIVFLIKNHSFNFNFFHIIALLFIAITSTNLLINNFLLNLFSFNSLVIGLIKAIFYSLPFFVISVAVYLSLRSQFLPMLHRRTISNLKSRLDEG